MPSLLENGTTVQDAVKELARCIAEIKTYAELEEGCSLLHQHEYSHRIIMSADGDRITWRSLVLFDRRALMSLCVQGIRETMVKGTRSLLDDATIRQEHDNT